MYNFDQVINRKNTNSVKYDGDKMQDPQMIPMWVADMDFEDVYKRQKQHLQLIHVRKDKFKMHLIK